MHSNCFWRWKSWGIYWHGIDGIRHHAAQSSVLKSNDDTLKSKYKRQHVYMMHSRAPTTASRSMILYQEKHMQIHLNLDHCMSLFGEIVWWENVQHFYLSMDSDVPTLFHMHVSSDMQYCKSCHWYFCRLAIYKLDDVYTMWHPITNNKTLQRETLFKGDTCHIKTLSGKQILQLP